MSTATITDNIHDRLAALRAYGQDLADAEQGHAECVAEARNEVALYGDSGPGSALRNSESAAALSRMRAQFDALFVAFVDDFPEYGPAVPASHKFAEEPF